MKIRASIRETEETSSQLWSAVNRGSIIEEIELLRNACNVWLEEESQRIMLEGINKQQN